MKKEYKLSQKNIRFDLYNFKNYDLYSNIKILNTSTKSLYINIQKELAKRRICFRLDDFNYLFFNNLEILSKYINNFYNNKSSKLVTKKLNYPLKLTPFYSLTDIEKFNIIFDIFITNNSKISKLNYQKYFKINRKKLNNNISMINKLSIKDIKRVNQNKKLDSNYKFIIKKKKFKRVNIFVMDIQKNEFEFLFKIISILFKNQEFKIYNSKILDLFNFENKKYTNIFLMYNSKQINKSKWTNPNKYILSIKDLKDDLYYLFSKNKEKTINYNEIRERKIIYNHKYNVSNRVQEFIKLIRKEENEYQKFFDCLL